MAGKKYYDNDNLTDYSPYGYNPKTGTQYREDGAPVNYAGTGDDYRRKGGSQEGYNSKGNAENRSYRDSVSDYGGWSDKGSWSSDSWGYSDDYVRRAYGGSGGDPYYSRRGGSGGGSSYSWNRNPYADALAAANAAQQAALEQGRTALSYQKTGVNQSFDDLAKQAYTNYMVNDKKMRQQTGTLATGTADSLALQGQLGYENNLNTNERERQNTLTGIDNDILSLEQQAQQNIAANEEKYALMTEEYNQQMEQQAYERALAEKQAALEQAELERQIQQQELENSWRERELKIQEGNANRSRSSGGDGGSVTPPTFEQLYQMKELGLIDDNEFRRQLALQYGVDTDQEVAQDTVYNPLQQPTLEGEFDQNVSPVVGNKHDDIHVEVPGRGRITWVELASLLDSGEIEEKVSNGVHIYQIRKNG